jgi:hypothetical protein
MDSRRNTCSFVPIAACCLAVVLLVVETGCTSRLDEGPDRWQALFNGQDLAGWTIKCKPADQGKDFWRVEDGCIVADSMGRPEHDYIWLMTDNEYSDFTVRLRFQAFRDSPGNSGVQIRSRYDDQVGWLDGPQIDINPPGPWRTGMIWDETRGSGRWLHPPIPKGQWVDPSMANPGLVLYHADDQPAWNALEVRAVGPKVTVVLNDVLVTSYDGAGVLDNDLHRERGVGLNGHIALQIHTGDQLKIRFKDIVLRESAP